MHFLGWSVLGAEYRFLASSVEAGLRLSPLPNTEIQPQQADVDENTYAKS